MSNPATRSTRRYLMNYFMPKYQGEQFEQRCAMLEGSRALESYQEAVEDLQMALKMAESLESNDVHPAIRIVDTDAYSPQRESRGRSPKTVQAESASAMAPWMAHNMVVDDIHTSSQQDPQGAFGLQLNIYTSPPVNENVNSDNLLLREMIVDELWNLVQKSFVKQRQERRLGYHQ